MCRRSTVILAAVFGLALAATACSKDPQKLKLQFVASGDRYMAQAKYAEAVIEYRNAVAQDARFGEAHYKLASAYLLASDLRNALGESVRGADLMPTNVEAQVQAGKLLLMVRQYPEARARAVTALKQEPKNVDALMLMGNALAGMKDIDGAITQMEEAIDSDPRRTLTYANLGAIEQARGNAAAAEAAFKRAVDAAPKSADAHLSLANYYWATNQRADAEREFKLALDLDPKSVSGNRLLAVFYLAANRPNEAEQYLKAYASFAPGADPKVILADYYLESSKTQDAMAVLEGLQKTPEGFVPAKIRLAAVDFAADRRAQAYQTLDEVFKREPKNEAALLEKVRFLLVDKKAAEALPLVNTVVAGNPGSIVGHYLRGVVLTSTGNSDEAIKAYRKVLELSPSAVPAQMQLAGLLLDRGEAAAAVEFLGLVIKAQPLSGSARFLLAKALLQQGNLAGAEREVMLVANTNQASADVQTLLGDLYLAKRSLGPAREAYTRASNIQPGRIEALTGLIKVDLAENKKDAAWARIESRLAASPDDGPLLLLAGATAIAVGDQKRAELVFRHVLEQDPSNLAAYANLGRIYMSQNRLDEAMNDYQESARRQPKTVVAAKTMMATILGLQGKPAEATKLYEEVIALDPTAAVAANNLAWNYADGGANLDQALKLAQTAKAQLPQAWEVDDTLGWIYYKKGLASIAITSFSAAVKQKPTNPTLHYHLGLAYLETGNRAAAQQSLEQALKLDPKFAAAEDARRALATIKG